jgi:hypothetical protein
MDPNQKDKVAIGICLLSAGGAVAGLRAGWHLSSVIMDLALIWSSTGIWASRLPRFWNKNFRELYRIALDGGLRESWVAKFISLGSLLMIILFVVTSITT